MKLGFANYKISHIAAFVAAFAIHAGIIATSMMPSDPIVLNKQAIQVSFVAPSANNSKAKNTTRQEIALNIESKKALYKKKDQQKKSLKKNHSPVKKPPDKLMKMPSLPGPLKASQFLTLPT